MKYSFRSMSLQVNHSEQNTNDADGCIKRWLGILKKKSQFLKDLRKMHSKCFPLDDGIFYIIMKVTGLRY